MSLLDWLRVFLPGPAAKRGVKVTLLWWEFGAPKPDHKEGHDEKKRD